MLLRGMFIVGITMLIGCYAFLSIPQPAFALGAAANAMCNPWNAGCPCGAGINPPKCNAGGPNKANCPVGICFDITSKFETKGICPMANLCEGKTSSGGGGDMKGLQEALGMIKQIADLFKGGGGGGAPAGGAPTGDIPGSASGCERTYIVTQPTTDPCAIYNPTSISGGIGSISDALLDALKGSTATSSTTTKTGTGSTVIKITTPSGTKTTGTQATSSTSVNVSPLNGTGKATGSTLTPSTIKPAGYTGDVKVLSSGATIIANFREGLTEVAGFFGSNTIQPQASQSAAGRLCTSRPWTRGILSNVIPGSFFDGLCKWSGYQVGQLAPTGTVSATGAGTGVNTGGAAGVQQPSTRAGSASTIIIKPAVNSGIKVTTPAPVVQVAKGEVDIWAEPDQVRLGARTYIFWNSRNVVSCRSTGPSFLQTTLSGGASTVPITGPSTFTIECMTAASTTVRDTVTVQIAL